MNIFVKVLQVNVASSTGKQISLVAFLFFMTYTFIVAQAFTGSFDMVVVQKYKNGNVRNDTLSYHFGDHNTAILIYGNRNYPDMRMVFSPSEKTITSLFELNGKKGGFILPMNEEYWPGMSEALRPVSDRTDNKANYTGEFKEIEGFHCKEVLAENEEYEATLWLAEDIPLSMTQVLSYQSVGKGKSKKEIELFDRLGIQALPLRMFLKSKEGRADVDINLINFKETIDEGIFSTEGHTLSKI